MFIVPTPHCPTSNACSRVSATNYKPLANSPQSRRAQSALEVAMLIGFLLAILTVFMAVVMNQMTSSQAEQDRESLNDVAGMIGAEVQLAAGSENGYRRDFNVPNTIAGHDYNIWFFDSIVLGGKDFSEIQLQYSGGYLADHTIVKYLPSNVFGNINKGANNVTKRSGVISVSAASNACVVKKGTVKPGRVEGECLDGENDILHLYSQNNAHAEQATQSNYAYKLCCGAIQLQSGGTTLLTLSAATNAHAHVSGYGVQVGIAPVGGVGVGCKTVSGAGDGYTVCNRDADGYNLCVITLSSLTNAHLASCNYQPYDTKLCCKVT